MRRLILLPLIATIMLVALTAMTVPAVAAPRGRAQQATPNPSVATYLGIAANYWHRSTVPSWEWGSCGVQYSVACAWQGADHIIYQRADWDRFTRYEKCAVTLHEYAHAVLNLGHSTGIMSPNVYDQVMAAPVACFSPPLYAQRIYVR